MYGLVGAGPGLGHGYYRAVAHNQVRAHYYAHVIQLQALAGVDAAHFAHRIRLYYPGLPVRVQVPGGFIAVYDNVFKRRRFLAYPFPAVAGHHAGFVPGLVLLADKGVQLGGAVHYAEVVIFGVQRVVGGFGYGQRVIQPGKVAVRAVAAELGLQLEFGDLGVLLNGPAADLFFVAYVFKRYLLVFVHKEHAELAGVNQFFNLVLAQVAENTGLFLKAVCLVHNKAIVLVGLGLIKGFRTAEHIIYARAPQRASQFGRVHKAGRGIARNVLRHHILPGKRH